ncbi:MAG: TIGR02996 domain-containing protein [Planctomycetes bacterium]|nr:TIGR02996 domain-containing protein [Planctomycetota bacterium]
MHDEAGFLSAIRQTPADDTARLVFADWLDEQDDPACQTKAEFIRLELRMAETPEQPTDREFRRLAAQLDSTWLAVMSHPKLEACRFAFQFECPKRWEQLTPTTNERVRFCEACKKEVHYCDELEYARTITRRGGCVALSLAILRRPGDLTGSGTVRLTPEMIERLRAASVRGQRLSISEITRAPSPLPPAPPVTTTPIQVLRVRRPGERPEWKQRRRKARRKNRNLQRENWEDAE